MTGAVFGDYFKNKLHRELEVYCKQEGLPFKILLVVDNAPSHPASLADISDNIKIAFLPPNTTSLIQPCDQGIISTFKSYYLRSTLADLVKVTEEENITVKEYWIQFSVKNALNFIKRSWDEVPRTCLNGVWKKLCPQFVHDFKGFSIKENVAKSNSRSLRLAQQLGFSDVEEEDIDELLQSHEQELSNEDLLEIEKERVEQLEKAEAAAAASASREQPLRTFTATNLAECMEHIQLAMAIIEENDSNVDRSSTVSREVISKMACYQLMLKEKQKKKKQSMMSFFHKRSETSETDIETDTDVRSDTTPTDTNSEREAESEVEL